MDMDMDMGPPRGPPGTSQRRDRLRCLADRAVIVVYHLTSPGDTGTRVGSSRVPLTTRVCSVSGREEEEEEVLVVLVVVVVVVVGRIWVFTPPIGG